MKKTKTIFQSYLILGEQEEIIKEIHEIAKKINMIISSNSPDVSVVGEDQSASITIDQIRQIKREIFQKPLTQKFKIVIIKNAQKLTTEAQNALLKILEEPPQSALIILGTRDKSSLLPTILSRVIIVKTQPQAKKLASQTNLHTLDTTLLLEEIAKVEDPVMWLDNQVLALHHLLRKSISTNQLSSPPAKISDIIEKCIEAKKMLSANVNPQFVLSNLIFSIKNL